MTWFFEWGAKEEMLHKVWQQSGIKPPALEQKPTLLPELRFDVEVFHELRQACYDSFNNRCRIALRDVLDYAELYCINRLDTQRIWSRVSLLQALWNTQLAERQPQTNQ